MIACCSLVGSEALGCPALTAASGVRMYSEEALADKFFQVPPETSAVDDLMSLAFVKGTVLFHSGECRVALDRLRAPYP